MKSALSSAVMLSLLLALGQLQAQPPAQAGGQQQEGLINLRDEANLNLQALVRWAAEEQQLKIVDDNKLAGKTSNIVFYGEARVDRATMLQIVQAILRGNRLALVKSDVEGWHQIVDLPDVRPFAPQGKAQDFQPAEYVTGVFSLKYITANEADNYLKQLIFGDAQSQTGNQLNSTAIPPNLLIVTETAVRLAKIETILEQIDIPRATIIRKFYKVKNLEAKELENQLNQILSDLSPGEGSPDSGQPAGRDGRSATATTNLKISTVLRTNQLVLIGTQAQIDDAMQLIEDLDVEIGLELKTYQFEFVAAKQIDDFIRRSLVGLDEEAIERVYQSTVNEQGNQLLVTARAEIQKRIESLKKQLDVETQASQRKSPIRFYTLKNVKAIDILDTLQAIERRALDGRRSTNQQQIENRLTGIDTRDGIEPGGLNRLNRQLEGPLPTPPFLRDEPLDTGPGRQSDLRQGFDTMPFSDSVIGDLALLASEYGRTENVIPGEARITVDENTNTLIVVAEPAIQQLYADMIEKLDKRRPQVLIEVHVVIISGSDDFSLGIEISGMGENGLKRWFAFSSYGLSEIDATTGALSIIPGLGFNGTLVDPETADVVIRALANHRRSRVMAAPRILVNDNATGLLSSVAEEPFASINAANTVSTTSFAGFAQAGTTISVTPQISEDNYLNLEFDVQLNNFTGAPSATGLPPPRNTDQVTSEVTIPDGHTVIVGGLTRRGENADFAGIPVLERIPIVSLLTGAQTRESERQKLFVFIKPIILRDDKFRDLRFLSDQERCDACIPDDLPPSRPVLIK